MKKREYIRKCQPCKLENKLTKSIAIVEDGIPVCKEHLNIWETELKYSLYESNQTED